MSLPDPHKITHPTAALGMCVDALDQLREVERNRRTASFSNSPIGGTPDVGWVVRALCDRYGIPLGEIVTRCERGHIDDLSPQTVDLIRNGVIR